MNLVDAKIEEYSFNHTSEESELFKDLRKITFEQTAAPQMQVGRVEGQFLKLLARISGAKRILEIGMFTGYSTLMMAEALPEGGEVVTCDIDPRAEEIAQSFFNRSPHGKKIKIHVAPAIDTLKTLTGSFDMAFIDADKRNYGNYYEACMDLVRSGGLIVIDNVLWSGKVLEPADKDAEAIAALNKLISEDKRVEHVLLTVRDGMHLVWKK